MHIHGTPNDVEVTGFCAAVEKRKATLAAREAAMEAARAATQAMTAATFTLLGLTPGQTAEVATKTGPTIGILTWVRVRFAVHEDGTVVGKVYGAVGLGSRVSVDGPLLTPLSPLARERLAHVCSLMKGADLEVA
jgi:hypothetical protein